VSSESVAARLFAFGSCRPGVMVPAGPGEPKLTNDRAQEPVVLLMQNVWDHMRRGGGFGPGSTGGGVGGPAVGKVWSVYNRSRAGVAGGMRGANGLRVLAGLGGLAAFFLLFVLLVALIVPALLIGGLVATALLAGRNLVRRLRHGGGRSVTGSIPGAFRGRGDAAGRRNVRVIERR